MHCKLSRWLMIGAMLAVGGRAFSQSEVEPPDRTIEQAEPAQEGKTQTEAEHTVVPGDTLWDLCARYLNNPWYWPRVWSYNPEITNPHWIYPGQVIRFYPTGELPSEILAAGEMEVPEPVEEEPVGEEIPPEELIKMTGKFVQAQTVRAVSIQRDAFVTREEVDELGTIIGSPEEKKYLAQYDRIYVKLKQGAEVQQGKRLAIIRTVKKIYHPITEEFRGYYTRILGVGRVLAVEGTTATVEIATSLDPIVRGDRVAPWVPDFERNVTPRRNGVELKGYIMDSRVALANLGERHIVFIDQGAKQGVEEGNIFEVVRREDGYLPMGVVRQVNAWDKRFPMEIVGRVMVIDARPDASTGIVLDSLKELQAGDRVLMTVQ